MDGTAGLRERKKAETRVALSSAALSLALERGLDAVTADDIAAAANVSPRTFHNYYGSKEEALIAGFRTLLTVYVEQLAARPSDEPVLESLERVLGAMAADAATRRDETKAHLALLASPGLARHRGMFFEEAVRALTDVVASRTRTDPQRDVYPRLVAIAAVAAVVTVYDLTGTGGAEPRDTAARLRECFRLLRDGLGDPPADAS